MRYVIETMAYIIMFLSHSLYILVLITGGGLPKDIATEDSCFKLFEVKLWLVTCQQRTESNCSEEMKSTSQYNLRIIEGQNFVQKFFYLNIYDLQREFSGGEK